MSNELLLLIQLLVMYAVTIGVYKFFGVRGIIAWAILLPILANIEVMVQIKAFGMPQTLANILFAMTYVCTDIISEKQGRTEANKVVNLGIVFSVIFMVLSQFWTAFKPLAGFEYITDSFAVIFGNTPRIIVTSILVYALVQKIDIILYEKIWKLTEAKTGSKDKLLWLRSFGASFVSQIINTILFTFGALLAINIGSFQSGFLSFVECLAIIPATLLIFIITSLTNLPIIYACRKITPKVVESVTVPATPEGTA